MGQTSEARPYRPSVGRWLGINTIYGANGDHDTPYMTRAWIGRLRLHIFHRPDADPDCHDHPWDFWTLPLTPYVEEVALPAPWGGFLLTRQIVRAFRLHYRPATHCHRVLGPYTGRILGPYEERKVVTLVWRGREARSWGFLKNRNGEWCWTPWKEYVFGGGKKAPCAPTEGGDE